jgi:Stress responsive A/B Barrel Domain
LTVWHTTVVTLAPAAQASAGPAAAGPAAGTQVRAALEASAAGAAGLLESWVRPTLPGVVRGGDLIRHLGFEDEDAVARWRASSAYAAPRAALTGAAVSACASATYGPGRAGARALPGSGAVYRALLLRAEADERTLARFEDELFAMGEVIPVMRRWRLSRLLACEGPVPWTHVWEQVFPEPDALRLAYMRHPYHWGQVDRWFDGESPDRIVTIDFCHTFCLLAS